MVVAMKTGDRDRAIAAAAMRGVGIAINEGTGFHHAEERNE